MSPRLHKLSTDLFASAWVSRLVRKCLICLHFSEEHRFSVDNFGDSLSPATSKPCPTRLSTTCLFIWQFKKSNEIKGLEMHENVNCEKTPSSSQAWGWLAAVHKSRSMPCVKGGRRVGPVEASARLSDCRSIRSVQFIAGRESRAKWLMPNGVFQVYTEVVDNFVDIRPSSAANPCGTRVCLRCPQNRQNIKPI